MKNKDLLLAALLLLIFAPLYLISLHTIPWQVNTDEITIMVFMKKLTEAGASLWGLSDYFGFPNLPFIIFGRLGNLLGGITLANIRTVHAFFGLAIIMAGYCFFRQIFEKRAHAFGAAMLLGANHALLAISRMAMRDNSGLFAELAAFTILLAGLKRRSLPISFLGGVAMALTFYVYFPSRAAFIIWTIFCAALVIFMRKKYPLPLCAKHWGAALAGFLITVFPVAFATFQAGPGAVSYAREQFLFLPEGQKLAQQWTGGIPVREAIKKNIIDGLTMFNRPLTDKGFIYPNQGHGFVDPLTGVLLWIGIAGAVFRLVRRRATEGDLLAGVGFFALYLAFAFLITKAPNYTRLLVLLPFVAYFAMRGALVPQEIFSVFAKKKAHRVEHFLAAGAVFSVALVMATAFWNAVIFGDFATKGLREGNDVGSTARYAEERSAHPGYSFILAASHRYPYYGWGESYQWQTWLGFFAGKDQPVRVVDPDALPSPPATPPFSVLFQASAREKVQQALAGIPYGSAEEEYLTADGRLRAIEVLP